MLIRTAFNNAGWAGKCTNAADDKRLYKCQKGIVDVGYGRFTFDEEGVCTSACDEARLCTELVWHSYHGKVDKKRAEGTAAYFVFPDIDSTLTLWGRATIDCTEDKRVRFLPFSPLPEEQWVRHLRADEILGKPWGQGTYRFIDSVTEAHLEILIAAMVRCESAH
jgi:hypothetical protein